MELKDVKAGMDIRYQSRRSPRSYQGKVEKTSPEGWVKVTRIETTYIHDDIYKLLEVLEVGETDAEA